ncbi:MAG: lipopolysaccharide biosynthesis [Pseudomonadota bacterium]
MNLDIAFYWRLLSRRLPVMVFLFVVASCVGGVVALRLPPVYEANAKLLVESAQIPDDMVRSTVRIDTAEQLAVIEQRLMTRVNLLDVARKNRIFPDQASMSPDDVVRAMREQTRISRSRGRQGANLMEVKFEGENPRKVAGVVDDYVTIILEANSDFRAERVEGTMDFFEQEVGALSDALNAQSEKIVAFKSENSGALPENLNYRLGRQSLLQERLSRSTRDLETLAAQRESIARIYQTTGSLDTVPGAGEALSAEQLQLRSLQAKLRDARLIFSEENPRIRLLRSQVEALQQEISGALGDAPVEVGAEVETAAPNVLDLTLAELDARADALREEIKLTSDEIEELQVSINKTPSVRIALDAMERDQLNIQGQYNAAVQRLSQARMGERVELSSRGERITILEPASVPNAPSRPNRTVVAGMGVMVGTGLAVGFFVLLELINTTIRRPFDITKAMQITPLATIPLFETRQVRRKRRLKQLLGLVIVVLISLAALWVVDTYVRPLDQLAEKVIERFF